MHAAAPHAPVTPLPVMRAGDLPTQAPEHRWLIHDLWARQAVGLVGGHPKSCLCRARHKQDYAASRIMPRG